MSLQADLQNLIDVPRASWDDSAPQLRALRTWDDIEGIEFHHTGARGPKGLDFAAKQTWMKTIERYHRRTKGWSDIFYNLFIFADGEVWVGRDLLRQSQGDTTRYLTVHIPGNDAAITPLQEAKAREICDLVASGPSMIRGHSDRAATACPGNNARAMIERIKTVPEAEIETPPPPAPVAPPPIPLTSRPTPDISQPGGRGARVDGGLHVEGTLTASSLSVGGEIDGARLSDALLEDVVEVVLRVLREKLEP